MPRLGPQRDFGHPRFSEVRTKHIGKMTLAELREGEGRWVCGMYLHCLQKRCMTHVTINRHVLHIKSHLYYCVQ